jgi:hypothetical protein
MAAKAAYIGLEKILSAFEEKADTPFFSMWWGKTKFEQSTINDFDKAKDKIENQVKAFLEEDINDIFIIALHPEKKVSYTPADLKDSVQMFCQTKKTDSFFYPGNSSNNVNFEILEKLRAMESKINALEDDTEEDTDSISGNDDVIAKYLDKINSIVNSPVAIAGMGLLAGKAVTSSALASPDEDELSKILTTLFQKGVTIAHLKKLSEYPANKIQMLLSMM